MISPNVKMVDVSSNKEIAEMVKNAYRGMVHTMFGDLPNKDVRPITRIHENGIFEINAPLSKDCDISPIEEQFKLFEENDLVYQVNGYGIKNGDDTEEKGSVRYCTNNSALAKVLDKIIIASDAFPTTNYELSKFPEYYNGVSSYFRMMKYEAGGMHYPHYDSDYDYGDGTHTRYSLVMYFTDNESGEIAFIDDQTDHASDKSDWTRQATPDEVTIQIKPKCMKIVLFPHELCHTVMELTEGTRIMARGDLIFSQR